MRSENVFPPLNLFCYTKLSIIILNFIGWKFHHHFLFVFKWFLSPYNLLLTDFLLYSHLAIILCCIALSILTIVALSWFWHFTAILCSGSKSAVWCSFGVTLLPCVSMSPASLCWYLHIHYNSTFFLLKLSLLKRSLWFRKQESLGLLPRLWF